MRRIPLCWLGSTLRDLQALPEEVKRQIGYALAFAQEGGKHMDAKPMKGFRGTSVMEIVIPFQTDTYRAVYTTAYKHSIFVLHVFMKKSTSGISTPKRELETIQARLRHAALHGDQQEEEEGNK